MRLVALQPAGSESARAHYADTISKPVPIQTLRRYFPATHIGSIVEIYADEPVPTWGVTPGTRQANVAKWERLNPADVVLMVRRGTVFASGVVAFTARNPALAEHLWGRDANGMTWEYVYLLDHVRDLELPVAILNRAAGYRPLARVQSFSVLGPDRSASVLQAFPEIAGFDATVLVRRFLGRPLATVARGRRNVITAIDGTDAIVSTSRTIGSGERIPIPSIQESLDNLVAQGSLSISVDELGSYRSSFLGALLAKLPGVVADSESNQLRLSSTNRDAGRPWNLSVGERITRKALHDRFGGNREGGISPSRRTNNLLVFTDSLRGTRHGYLDHWDGETLHYYGEGQHGDQTLTGGNLAILSHRESAVPLRLFDGAGGVVTYLGEFALDAEEPYYWNVAPDTEEGSTRRMIVFRLRPSEYQPSEIPTRGIVKKRPYRKAHAKPSIRRARLPEPNLDALDRSRAQHVDLQNTLAFHVEHSGCSAHSPTPLDPSFDVAWTTPSGQYVVAEVKSLTNTNEEQQLRLGLGQILFYCHVLRLSGQTARPVLFVERRPREQVWSGLCDDLSVTLAWPDNLESLPLA